MDERDPGTVSLFRLARPPGGHLSGPPHEMAMETVGEEGRHPPQTGGWRRPRCPLPPFRPLCLWCPWCLWHPGCPFDASPPGFSPVPPKVPPLPTPDRRSFPKNAHFALTWGRRHAFFLHGLESGRSRPRTRWRRQTQDPITRRPTFDGPNRDRRRHVGGYPPPPRPDTGSVADLISTGRAARGIQG